MSNANFVYFNVNKLFTTRASCDAKNQDIFYCNVLQGKLTKEKLCTIKIKCKTFDFMKEKGAKKKGKKTKQVLVLPLHIHTHLKN